MKKSGKEFWVGVFVMAVIALIGVFGWLMGVIRPFSQSARFSILYSFAGGVEVGSPVRVSGVKVGKVERIEFLREEEREKSGATLRLLIGVSKRSASAIRSDSKFFVNMAGIIGERYIEISPGTSDSPSLSDGAEVRGIDPPRVDQLLSQGYGVFGKIQDFLEENEPILQELVTQMGRLLKEMNQLMKGSDRKRLLSLIDNLGAVSSDIRKITSKFSEPEAREFVEKFMDLLRRAHQIDKNSLKKFLQEEGVRARIF